MSPQTERERPEPDEAPTTAQDSPAQDPAGRELDEEELPEAEVVEAAPAADANLTPEERLERERDEYYESWRRSQADFQNLRRRQGHVIATAVDGARRELFAELLIVLDYLDMALATPVETTEGQTLKTGIELTRNQMMQFLVQHEVERIDSSGAFDPELHEAVETVAGSGQEPGTIVETVRAGYTIAKDVLRYAHVKVAADEGGGE